MDKPKFFKIINPGSIQNIFILDLANRSSYDITVVCPSFTVVIGQFDIFCKSY